MNQRLAGLDSAFLALETHAAPMHMTAVVTLEPMDGRQASFEAIRDHLAPRLSELPVFRRNLREVPLGLDHPVWVEQDFELDAHLHRAAVPQPGSDLELEQFVAHLAALPLDRTRPLWDMWIVEGLEGGRTALVTKVHHALIDGVAGAEIFGRLFDAAPDGGRLHEEVPARRSQDAPSRAMLLRGAVRAMLRRPFDVAKQSLESASTAAKRIWSVSAASDREPALPAAFAAPETPLSGAITARRSIHFGSMPLEELKHLKREFGVKLNDVVLELCTGALRRYLSHRGELPDGPLVAAVPVSVAAADARHTTGNRVSAMTVELPVHLADPGPRLAEIHDNLTRAKRAHRAVGGDMLSGWAEVAPPILLSGLSDLYSHFDLADRHRPVVNMIVSNVPGPQFSLYCAGHRVQGCYPLGPIYEGCAVNLTVMSYDGRLHFGWLACPDAVPDLARLGSALSEAATELRSAAERRVSRPRIRGLQPHEEDRGATTRAGRAAGMHESA